MTVFERKERYKRDSKCATSGTHVVVNIKNHALKHFEERSSLTSWDQALAQVRTDSWCVGAGVLSQVGVIEDLDVHGVVGLEVGGAAGRVQNLVPLKEPPHLLGGHLFGRCQHQVGLGDANRSWKQKKLVRTQIIKYILN